jgi:hypothetical protein
MHASCRYRNMLDNAAHVGCSEDADLTGTEISDDWHEKSRPKDAVDHLDSDEKEPDIKRTFEEVAGHQSVG